MRLCPWLKSGPGFGSCLRQMGLLMGAVLTWLTSSGIPELQLGLKAT